MRPGAAVTIFAALKEYDVPLRTGAAVWAQIARPDQSSLELKLERTDASIYAASFKTSLPGVYSCRVRAEGLTSKGSYFTREQTLTAGVYYGNYDPVPQPDPNDVMCHLMECVLSEKVLSPATVKRFLEMGMDLKNLRECVSRICATKGAERDQNLVPKAFVAARKKQLQATPTLRFKKATAAKPLKRPAKPARQVPPKKEFVTMFTPIQDDLVGTAPMRHRTARNKKKGKR